MCSIRGDSYSDPDVNLSATILFRFRGTMGVISSRYLSLAYLCKLRSSISFSRTLTEPNVFICFNFEDFVD